MDYGSYPDATENKTYLPSVRSMYEVPVFIRICFDELKTLLYSFISLELDEQRSSGVNLPNNETPITNNLGPTFFPFTLLV